MKNDIEKIDEQIQYLKSEKKIENVSEESSSSVDGDTKKIPDLQKMKEFDSVLEEEDTKRVKAISKGEHTVKKEKENENDTILIVFLVLVIILLLLGLMIFFL